MDGFGRASGGCGGDVILDTSRGTMAQTEEQDAEVRSSRTGAFRHSGPLPDFRLLMSTR